MIALTDSVPPGTDSNPASPRDGAGDIDDATPAALGEDHLADQDSSDRGGDALWGTKGDGEPPNAHGEAETPVTPSGTWGPGALPSPERPPTSFGPGMNQDSTASSAALNT